MDDLNVSDAFFHEGKILAFYADDKQIENLIKSVLWLPAFIPQSKVGTD